MKSLNYLLTRCLLIALAICSPLIALASTKINGLYYDLNTTNQTAAVVNSSNYSSSLSGEVVIPSTVVSNGIKFTVTSISNGAFARCASITSIIIPGTVTSIGTTQVSNETNLPFYSCTALKSVRFEDGTSDIYLGASFSTIYGIGLFNSCPLEEVYIGRNIKYKDYNSSYKFKDYPECYGYSAFYNQSKLAKVTIGEGCTELTDYLFYKNSAITLLNLPNVKKIGNSTFEECTRLTTLNLGPNIEEVGNRGFYNCAYITKLTFPNALKSIGNYAFYKCTSITEVTIGNNLKTIGSYAFYNCKSFTALILPDGFTTMGESAFEDCTKLTIAKLGQSLTSVPKKAFKNCTSLSEMIIPGTATSIEDQAFYNDSGLATITMNEGLETIGSEVFYNNSGIIRFTIPGTVTSMGANSFYGCTNVSYLIFKDGIGTLNIDNTNCKSSKIDAITKNTEKRDRKYDYFYDCPIRFLTIGKNITYSKYSASVKIYDPNENEMVERASAPFVNHKDITSVTIGENVTVLYHHLLNGCSGISEIILPSGMEEIYSYALANLPAITSLILPDPLTLFGDYACANNTSLTSIIFNEEQGNSLSMSIGNGALSNCPGLTELTFPGKTTSIGSYCFKNTPNITKVRFNDSSSSVLLGSGSAKNAFLFGDCELRSRYIGRDIYSSSAFNYQTKLTDVRFSHAGTVTFCDDYLLYGVSSCKSLDLPESITELGSYAFAYMTVLDGINIPSKVSHLPKGLFSNDTSLSSITIHPAVVKMDGKIFENCSSLTTVTFEGNTELLVMGYGASDKEFGLFRDCPLVTLNLNRWLSYNTDTPSRSPFYSIATLKNLNIGENVKLIDKYMFSYCTGLVTLNLNDNVESVGEDGFRGCTSLKSVRLSENLSQVSDYGFSECTSLENIKFPASMTSIADNSFSNCTSLKNVDLGDKLMIIGPSAFKNDSAIEEIIMPESLYGLGVEAFANCTSMRSVVIRGISSVGKQSFQGCTGLQWVSLSDKTTSLGKDSFDGCTGIKYVKSYAELPPEGFVNFPELVPQKGTLFVPKNSVDYYRYSPTWENWSDIRPLVIASSLELNMDEVSLNVNGTTQLIATVGPADATEKSVIWKSSNTSVATVDANGRVTAVNFGDATITATTTDGSNLSASCKIRVTALATSITLNKTTAKLNVPETITLTATVLPTTTTNKSVTWKSSNEAVATVDANGKVTAVAVGEATITATTADGSNLSASCKITVSKIPAESITLNKTVASIKAAETITLIATVLPSNTSNKSVTWKSSNTSIATVDSNGKVTAVAVGESTITATTVDGSNLSASCKITVVKTLVESITLNKTTASLKVTETVQLAATVYPSTATNKSVTWKSSNTSVATVNSNGKVTAVSMGEATITATTADGSNKSATCMITVVKTPANSITLSQTTASLKANETVQLTATVYPSTATNKSVTWKSSKTSVATVDANGKVTAVSVGEATITATTADGSNMSATCKITVVKTLAESIALNTTTARLNVAETITLTATILPSTTTNKSVTWKSSNTSVATVNANGNVTAIGVGEATITATTTDGTNLSATCNVTVKEMLLGDVNDDSIINVTDVMTVVSHILGFSPDIFIFNAADINKDSKISITDIVAIVNIILNGERANDAPYITRAASHVALGSRLFVDDCSIEEGETMQLAVNLTNDIAFSGFQADIKLPEGLELCQEEGEYMISLSDRKGKDHVLTSAMRPDGTIRLLSYSMNLKEYAGTEGALIYLTVKAADNFVGDYEICINNITFVQANLTEYSLEPTVCHLTGTTEIEGVNDDVVVATIGDDIVVKNAPLGSSVRVYAADGGLIASKVATDGDVVVEAPVNGVYVVVVDGKSFKLMVK